MKTYTCSYSGGWNEREDDGPCYTTYRNKEDMYAMEKDGVVSLFCFNCGPSSTRNGWVPASYETKPIRDVPLDVFGKSVNVSLLDDDNNLMKVLSIALTLADDWGPVAPEEDGEPEDLDNIPLGLPAEQDFIDPLYKLSVESEARTTKIEPGLEGFLDFMYFTITQNYPPLSDMRKREIRLALKRAKVPRK